MARKAEEAENHWPGFVDALSTIVMVVTFLLIILSVAIFAISQQVAKGYIATAVERTDKGGGDQWSEESKVASADQRAALDSESVKKRTKSEQTEKLTESQQAEQQTKSAQQSQQTQSEQQEQQTQSTHQEKQSQSEAEQKQADQTQDQKQTAQAENKQQSPLEENKLQSTQEQAAQTKNAPESSFQQKLAERLTQDKDVTSETEFTLRSRQVDIKEKRIKVAADDRSDLEEKIEVKRAQSILTLEFDDLTTRLDQETGGSGNDTLSGTATSNTIIGGAGDDVIDGGGGSDVLDGGAGLGDTLDYASQTGAVNVNLATNVNNQGDTISNFENVTGGSGDDVFVGTSGDNVFNGGAGDDVITGAGGADTLIGGAGNDNFTLDEADLALGGFSLDGGTDTDSVIFNGGSTIDETEITTGVLSNVEVLDFTTAGTIADIDLSASDIQALTDANNTLEIRINGGDGDDVRLSDPVANIAEDNTTPGQTTFTIFDDATQTTQLAELTVVTV